jgi:hypothetical protein
LYAHCRAAAKPRITVTTHPAADGQWVWYLGGDLPKPMAWPASLPRRSPPRKRKSPTCCPGSTRAVRWATLRVDRRTAQSGLVRPDNAFLAEQRLLVGWPTKLALAPDFATGSATERDGIRPAQADLADLPRPPLGVPAWEQLLP